MAVAEKTKLTPLGSRIVVKPLKREEKTKSGLVLPDTSTDKPTEANVIAVGPGDRDDDGKRIPMDVKVGDHILYAKYTGTEFKIDDEDVLILSEKDVLAVIDK